MENEYMEEITEIPLENDASDMEIPLENEVSDTDNIISDMDNAEQAPLDAGTEGNASDLMPEQSEGDSSEAFPDMENETAYLQEELEQIISAVLMVKEKETSETIEETRTLFDTPLEEYTVSEGLLLCIFLLLLTNFIGSIFKRSHWLGKL